MNTSQSVVSSSAYDLQYVTLRNVTSPEDQDANRKRYCGIAKADKLLGLNWDENVRGYLGIGEDGKKRKSTLVNSAIRETLHENRDLFPLLNSGFVLVSSSAQIDDNIKNAKLHDASIINGAQTRGVLESYFAENADDKDFPSVNFELIVTNDKELIGDISIARNFQNRVADLSIYGRQHIFKALEEKLQKNDPQLKLRKSETDWGDNFVDTEKLIQALTALIPKDVAVPSAERNKKTAETIYRVYAYRHRSRCLKDFADVMEDPKKWSEAREILLEIAWEGWALYQRLKSEQFFSSLHCVKGIKHNGTKTVALDGVPDGIVFPMLSALSRFVKRTRTGWRIDIPKTFPWKTLFAQAYLHETTTASNNPQTMGKSAACYVALHGAIDMFFSARETE